MNRLIVQTENFARKLEAATERFWEEVNVEAYDAVTVTAGRVDKSGMPEVLFSDGGYLYIAEYDGSIGPFYAVVESDEAGARFYDQTYYGHDARDRAIADFERRVGVGLLRRLAASV